MPTGGEWGKTKRGDSALLSGKKDGMTNLMNHFSKSIRGGEGSSGAGRTDRSGGGGGGSGGNHSSAAKTGQRIGHFFSGAKSNGLKDTLN